jgi:hypothetical protein
MKPRAKAWVVAAVAACVLGVPSVRAQWVNEGTPICTVAGTQQWPRLTSDGAGGAVIVWEDQRGGDLDIYAQRVDADGDSVWTKDGVPVCTATGDQQGAHVIPDGGGGFIVAWEDKRAGLQDVYAQKLDGDGNALWTADGVALVTATGWQARVNLTTDGKGGAIVTWTDNRTLDPDDRDIYAQRVDASGVVKWTTDGVAIATPWNWLQDSKICPDGYGGAYITWQDLRTGGWWQVFAQRVDSLGTPRWATDGMVVSTGSGNRVRPQIAADGVGGAILTWDIVTMNQGIYAARLDTSGTIAWTTTVAAGVGSPIWPQLTPDGAQGAIIAWEDDRSGNKDVYAQTVDSSGAVQWTANGVPVCTAAGDQWQPRITSDEDGAAVIAWYDERTDTADVYAQKLDATGDTLWTADGLVVCDAAGEQLYPELVTDGSGGAVIAWQDARSGDLNIYVLGLGADGTIPADPLPHLAFVGDVPGDEGGWIRLDWEASPLDAAPEDSITYYSAWRRLDELAGSPPLTTSGAFFTREFPEFLEGSKIRVTSQGYAWEWLENVTAAQESSYTATVPSLYDRTPSDPAWQTFMVTAHTRDPVVFYDSPVDSGYSLDNIAPAPPESLACEYVRAPETGLQLTWNPSPESDFSHYNVYAIFPTAMSPEVANYILIGTPTGPSFFYGSFNPDYGYSFGVEAEDVHGNKSGWMVCDADEVTGTGDAGIPEAVYLSQNVPNPFNPATRIRFGVRETSAVTLAIYDVAGRLVRILVHKSLGPGHYVEDWDGRDDHGRAVASGVYFYRLDAGARSVSRRMVLLR